jgi:hypothetical protein
MKKFTFIVLLLAIVGTSSAQTILNRFPVELKKSSDYFQIFTAANEQNEYFAFVADKENLTVIKYNSALFFKDSLTVTRPDRNLDYMIGVTFSADGNPDLYWSSKNHETFKLIHFDFQKRTTSDLTYENNFARKKIIDVFVAKNCLNIVSITPENTLKFTNFSNVGKNDFTVPFYINESITEKSKADAIVNRILENGISIIDKKQFTPLYVGAAHVKRYLEKEQYILSIDSPTTTTLFTVNLNNFLMQKSEFPHHTSDKNSGSNSFLHQDVLYQLSVNSASLALKGTDLKTKNELGNYLTTAQQEIEFKNSPLFLQTENGNTRTIKNTAKMLSKINLESVGLSIYGTPNYNLFTIGGVREVASGGGLAMAIGLGIGGVLSGSDIMVGSDFISDTMQSMYFESYFDNDFKHTKRPFLPLYIDELGSFLNSNRPSVHSITPFRDYIILNYYDNKTKEFVMRKFEDVVD